MRLEALERVDVDADERVGVLGRDLLDLDPALRREHEQRLPGAAVERDREVVLARDLRGALDPEPADDVPPDVEAEDVLRRAPCASSGPAASFTPPAFPRPPVSTCALTTTVPPSSSAARARLLGRRRQPAARDRDPEPREQLLPLVLVEVHGRAETIRAARRILRVVPLRRPAHARPDRGRARSWSCSSPWTSPNHDYWGTVVFCLAMSTDWFDGRIARRSGRTTSFGSLLDPVADKVLVLATLVVLLDQQVFPAWMVAAIVARELLDQRSAARGPRARRRDRRARPREAEDVVAGDRRGRGRPRCGGRLERRASPGGFCSSRSS